MASTTVTTSILLLLAMTQIVMSEKISPKPKDFFPDIKGNLTKIIWAHAVNSKAELEDALGSDNIMMLEADVVIGKLNDTSNNSSNTDIPIMAHPPAKESDLSLLDFLNSVLESNHTKGIKLDFKSNEAFDKSKPILKKMRENLKFPVFLNADIIPGPVNADTAPLNATTFIKGAKEIFPESTLSVGWTTRYGDDPTLRTGSYVNKQMEQMVASIKENQVTQPVTYPLRAGLAANNIEVLKILLNESTPDTTLTIWSSEGDPVSDDKLPEFSEFLRNVGVDKVYVDVPESLRQKLNLSSSASGYRTGLMYGLQIALIVWAVLRL